MGEDFVYWLFFLMALLLGLFFGSRFMADTALIASLNIEIRSATQSAASLAFSSVSLEGIGERSQLDDRAHRTIILDKTLAKVRFEDALKENLNLDSGWVATSGQYIATDRPVVINYLHILDSSDLPYDFEGRSIVEPSVIVSLEIPVKFYSTKRDRLDVVRIIPLRTFITNWQR